MAVRSQAALQAGFTYSAILFDSSMHDELELAENSTSPPFVIFMLAPISVDGTQNIKPKLSSHS